MVWANAAILAVGGVLVLLPVILHFLMQPKPQRLIFPALRFLQERQQRNRNRLRLRHLLLLIVRCLLIALLALALAGPSVVSRDFGKWLTLGGIGISGLLVAAILLAAYFQTARNGLLIGLLSVMLVGHLAYGGWAASKLLGSDSAELLGDAQAPIAALVLIDASVRMDYRYNNQTRLEEAQQFAQWLLSQFPADSQVSVMTNDNDKPFFSVDVGMAKRRIETLTTNFSETSLTDAVLEGLSLLENAAEERKEIYVLTDLTRTSWGAGQTRQLLRRLESNSEIGLYVIDVGVAEPQNFALAPLSLSSSTIPIDGQIAIESEISRIGSAEQKIVRMVIEQLDPSRPVVRDGKVLFPDKVLEEQTLAVDVRENSRRPIAFVNSAPLSIGTYHGRIEIEGQDSLVHDNTRYFTFRVQRPWRVLVVHPTNVSPKGLVSTLAPPSEQAAASNYQCDVVTQEQFQDVVELAGYDAIYLLNPRPVDDAIWERLHGFVSRGGGLGITLGHNAVRAGFADPSFENVFAEELLCGKLDLAWDAGEEALFLSPQDTSHPLFRMLRPFQEGILWDRVPVYRYWGLDLDQRTNELPTQVLIRFTNGQPALIERQIGQGEVLVMLTPLTERAREGERTVWNELYNIPTFVPWLLMQMMTEFLVDRDIESYNIQVGQLAAFNNDLKKYSESYQVFTPHPETLPTRLSHSDNQIKFRFTDSPGHFRLKGSFDGQPLLRGFSVNLAEGATDLARIDPAELDEILGAGRYQLARDKQQIERQQGAVRKGQEFYGLLLVMMLVVYAIEYLMSNRFYGSS